MNLINKKKLNSLIYFQRKNKRADFNQSQKKSFSEISTTEISKNFDFDEFSNDNGNKNHSKN